MTTTYDSAQAQKTIRCICWCGTAIVLAMILGGCAALENPTAVRGGAMDEMVEAIVHRHDDYVAEDPDTEAWEAEEYLAQSTELYYTVIDAADSDEFVPVEYLKPLFMPVAGRHDAYVEVDFELGLIDEIDRGDFLRSTAIIRRLISRAEGETPPD